MQLRKAVLKEIQILEASEETNKLNYFRNPLYSIPSTSSLLANASQCKEPEEDPNRSTKQPPRLSKPRPCVFCKESHKPNDCTKVNASAARKLIVSQNLCFNCLNNHRVPQCKSKNRCRLCHQKHHTSLCLETKKTQEQPDPNTKKDVKAQNGNLQCTCTCTTNAPKPGTTNMNQQTPPHTTSTLASNLNTNLSNNKHLHHHPPDWRRPLLGRCGRQNNSRSWTNCCQIEDRLPTIWTNCHIFANTGAQCHCSQGCRYCTTPRKNTRTVLELRIHWHPTE